MYYKNYLDDYYYEELLSNYSLEYLQSVDEENFKKVYELLKKYNFYFIEDIIENYLELFELKVEMVEKGILKLKEELGNDFVYIIGDDLTLLDRILTDK